MCGPHPSSEGTQASSDAEASSDGRHDLDQSAVPAGASKEALLGVLIKHVLLIIYWSNITDHLLEQYTCHTISFIMREWLIVKS